MMLALCAEIEACNSGARFTIVGRRNAGLIADLALAYPSIKIIPIQKNIFGLCTLLWNSFKKPYVVLMPAAFGKSSFLNTRNFFALLRFRPGLRTYGLLKNAQEPDPYDASLIYDIHAQHFDNMRRLARLGGLAVKPDGSAIDFKIRDAVSYKPPFERGTYIVFHAFGSSSYKSFPPRRCRELLLKLIDRYPTLSFVMTGGSENKNQAEEISAGLPRIALALNLPVLELAALIKQSALYMGVDTGPTHVAGMLKKESIVLTHNMGPSWKPEYNPNAVMLTNDARCICDGDKGTDCLVSEDGLPYLRCLYDITDAQILEAVAHFISHA